MSDGSVAIEITDGVAQIRFERARKRNCFSRAMYAEFASAIRAARTDESVAAIMLTGSGSDFCAGNDLVDFLDHPAWDPDELADRTRTASTEIVHQLAECEKPIVAWVQGNAAGFGATMLLHCDYVIAHAAAKLHFPFIDLGLVPEAGATLLLPKAVGYLAAFDILTRGTPLTAAEAHRLGLVTAVADDDDGVSGALALAGRLGAKPREAMQQTKRLLKGDARELSERIGEEFKELGRRLSSRDARAIFQAMAARANRSPSRPSS